MYVCDPWYQGHEVDIATMVQYVLIPSDQSLPLKNLIFQSDEGDGASFTGDQLPSYLARTAAKPNDCGNEVEFEIVPVRRMSDDTPGVYAYFRRVLYDNSSESKQPNVRATCLLMACGQYSKRLYGDVYIGRYGSEVIVAKSPGITRNLDISMDEIRWGCISPDLRYEVLRNLCGFISKDDVASAGWLVEASKENYIDSIQIAALASAFDAKHSANEDDLSSSDCADEGVEDDGSDGSSAYHAKHSANEDDSSSSVGAASKGENENAYPRNVALCLHCRGPSEWLCEGCQGAYFCNDPRPCRKNGWSHECLCRTWRIYVQHRDELSTFPLGAWYKDLVTRKCQMSDAPYRSYLTNELKVLGIEGGCWWDTEVDGWAAGLSGSARVVDASIRRSYEEGFLLDASLIPAERRLTEEDYSVSCIDRDARGLPVLKNWKDYYTLRRIPLTSPVALLCTFPLTIY